MRTNQADVWRFLCILGCNGAQADDLTQEAFLEVWLRPFEIRSGGQTRSYLRKVARSRFLMAVRAEKCRPNFESIELAEETWSQASGEDGGGTYISVLEKCVDSLEERSRNVIELCYRDEMSGREIAQSMNLSEGNTKTVLRRAKEKLQDCVEQRMSSDNS